MVFKFIQSFFPKHKGIVIGGNGALGASVISKFIPKWEMTSIDFEKNKEATKNIIISPADDLDSQFKVIEKGLNGKYSLIMCTAGTWSKGTIENSEIFGQMDKNIKGNLYPAILTSYIATKYLEEMGLLIFTGSLATYKESTPNLLAYALSKNSVHYLALNMSKRESISSESTVVCILPDILNTYVNRNAYPTQDHSKWISPNDISNFVFNWAKDKKKPKNGSFVAFQKDKKITLEYL
jgi:hypothetical protein